MEDQPAVKVRFFKSRKIAFWRIFGEMDKIRLRHLCNQMTLFNNHHNVMFCVVDFSEANSQMSQAMLTKSFEILSSKEKIPKQMHIVFPERSHHISHCSFSESIDATNQDFPMTLIEFSET